MTWSPTSYDLYTYRTHAFRRSSPFHLSTIAALFGLTPVPPSTASVLELGCGDGRNLIPLASLLPNSSWLGIDRARQAIAVGREVLRRLSLTNIELIEADLLDETPSLGSYDYIIVHGILSWVPEAVRRRIFAIIRDHLSPEGVALLSYNAYPGWHIRNLIREGVLAFLSVHNFIDAQERLQAARRFLRDYSQIVRSEDNHDATLLKQEALLLSQLPDWLLHHDLLAEINTPLSFSQLLTLTEEFNLHYLSEADPSKILPIEFPPQLGALLDRYSHDHASREALLDLFRTRMFRTSLLSKIPPSPLTSRCLSNAYLSAKLKDDKEFEAILGEATVTFSHENGGRIQAKEKVFKCALHLLSKQWPKWVSFSELEERLRHPPYRVSPGKEVVPDLFRCMLANMVDVSYYEPPQPSLRHGVNPLVFPTARLYAQEGPLVPNLRHEEVVLSDEERDLLLLLDGAKGFDELVTISGTSSEQVKTRLRRFIELSLLLPSE